MFAEHPSVQLYPTFTRATPTSTILFDDENLIGSSILDRDAGTVRDDSSHVIQTPNLGRIGSIGRSDRNHR